MYRLREGTSQRQKKKKANLRSELDVTVVDPYIKVKSSPVLNQSGMGGGGDSGVAIRADQKNFPQEQPERGEQVKGSYTQVAGIHACPQAGLIYRTLAWIHQKVPLAKGIIVGLSADASLDKKEEASPSPPMLQEGLPDKEKTLSGAEGESQTEASMPCPESCSPRSEAEALLPPASPREVARALGTLEKVGPNGVQDWHLAL
ncbi:UNVERIFIED_CONTAM: hypothetical protein K2H54_038407 [Gekko kuhli]